MSEVDREILEREGIGSLERGGLSQSKGRVISSAYRMLLHETNVTNVVGDGQSLNLT